MSTRCNIKITGKDQKEIWLRRHCDGYYKGTGENLISLLKHRLSETGIYDSVDIANILLQYHEIRDYKYNGSPVYQPYELSNGQNGDIEWLYVIDLSKLTLSSYTVSSGGKNCTQPFVLKKIKNLRRN